MAPPKPGALFFCRKGDPAVYDRTLAAGDFVTDGNWHDLDLTNIVPVFAHAVLYDIVVQDNVANSIVVIKPKGNINLILSGAILSRVAGQLNHENQLVCVGLGGLLEYWATNTIWDVIQLVVLGWFV